MQTSGGQTCVFSGVRDHWSWLTHLVRPLALRYLGAGISSMLPGGIWRRPAGSLRTALVTGRWNTFSANAIYGRGGKCWHAIYGRGGKSMDEGGNTRQTRKCHERCNCRKRHGGLREEDLKLPFPAIAPFMTRSCLQTSVAKTKGA